MKDAIIVGGGVIGCAVALRLAGEGLQVAVIERGRVGCEASRAAAGMLSPQAEASEPGPFLDLCLRSRAMYRDFAELLKDASGIDVEYRDEGTLCVAVAGEDPEHIARWASWQKAAALPLEELSADDLRALEPGLSERAARGVFIPGDHQVENRRLMDALDAAIRHAGVEVIEGAEVARLIIERDRAVGVVCNEQAMYAGAVVVAAGSWSSRLLHPAGLRVHVTPARGQMIALRGAAARLRHVLHSSRAYVVPRLADCEVIEAWAGFRPDTEDHLPVIGPCEIANLFLATGHFRNGILLAPVTAELLARCVTQPSAPDELRPFLIKRFDEKPFAGSIQDALPSAL